MFYCNQFVQLRNTLRSVFTSLCVILVSTLIATVASAQTPTPTPITKSDPPTVQTPSTVGKIPKWIGVSKSGIGIIGDSIMTESGGNVGIDVTNPTAKLTVGGTITAAGMINTDAQYNIGGARIVGYNPTYQHLFLGAGAGQNNFGSPGIFLNTFIGSNAGYNATGGWNTFVGAYAGYNTATNLGADNSFFGVSAGYNNRTGQGNSFFGRNAGNGSSLSSGNQNAAFGYFTGLANVGSQNSFFGAQAGKNNSTGTNNLFLGYNAGFSNTTESNNTFIGTNTNGAAGITNATALGANAVVTQSNSVVLGNNANVGIGTSAPQAKLHVVGSTAGQFDGNVTINGDITVSGAANLNARNAIRAATADNATNFTGSLAGDVTGSQNATVVSSIGGKPAASVASATDAFNNASSANAPNNLVKRDGAGNFSAGTITASLNGNASTATTANRANSLANTATVNGSQVNGALTNATIAGNAVTGNVAASQVTGNLANATLDGNRINFPIAVDTTTGGAIIGATNQGYMGLGLKGVGGSYGVYGESLARDNGILYSAGVAGQSGFYGVKGVSTYDGSNETTVSLYTAAGVLGIGTTGVFGSTTGVSSHSQYAPPNVGVWGNVDQGGTDTIGVLGRNTRGGTGVFGGGKIAVHASADNTFSDSLAGLFDGNVAINGNLSVTGTTNISSTVNHDATLTGNGSTASPLSLASDQVVKSLNGFTNNVTLAAGSNITITPSGNTLTIASTGGGGSSTVNHDSTLKGDGSSANPLGVNVPLSLSSTGQVTPLNLSTSDEANFLSGTNNATMSVYLGSHAVQYGIDNNPNCVVCRGQSPEWLGFVAPVGVMSLTDWHNGTGVSGVGGAYGVYGESTDKVDADGYSVGVFGVGPVVGVKGISTDQRFASAGVAGVGNVGVIGATTGTGDGGSVPNVSIWGEVEGTGPNMIAVWGRTLVGGTSLAGRFDGNVVVNGTLSKSAGSFKIDDPIDPANKTLSHSFVESPDMMNIYNGNVTTDAQGRSTILMPRYFSALNRDFRYQLTVIGQFAQAIVENEIKDNQFTIKTDKPNVKVSWQVTGVRQDLYANANRISVEEDKPADQRGRYLNPELYGKPRELGIFYVPPATTSNAMTTAATRTTGTEPSNGPQ